MTYKITSYHKQVVTNYYISLINRFGPPALIRHIPKIKKLVWPEEGLALIEYHKAKRENHERQQKLW